MRFLLILFLPFAAFGQAFLKYNTNTFFLTPTNTWKSNLTAGANITIAYDANGRPTFSTSGSSSIIVQTNGVNVATNSTLNIIAGSNISILATNNTGDGKVDLQIVSTGAGDSDAIHDNVAGEIAAVADKASPASGDHILIEDSADSDNKKDVTLGSLESLLEGLMDLQDMQGAVTDSQVPNTITVDLATVAATANAGDSATAFFSAGEIEDARIAATLTRDTEWDTEGEVQTAWGGVNVLLETEIDASSELKALMDDEEGSGPLVFAHGPTLGTVTVSTNLGVAGNAGAGSLNVTNLTASQAVVTDANKQLASVAYTGAGNVMRTRTGVYREIYIPAGAITPATTNGAALGTNTVGSDGLTLDTLDFDDTTVEYGWFHIAMPDVWDHGTIKAKFTWTTTSGTGGVVWGLAGGAVADDGTLNGTVLGTAQTVADTRLADHDLHLTSATAAITVGGTPTLAKPVFFRVHRLTSDGGDDKTGDARLIGIKIQYLETATEASAW